MCGDGSALVDGTSDCCEGVGTGFSCSVVKLPYAVLGTLKTKVVPLLPQVECIAPVGIWIQP